MTVPQAEEIANGHAVGSRFHNGDVRAEDLEFAPVAVNGYVMYRYKDGVWDKGEFRQGEISLHPLSNVFNYGQSLFEGMKAFHTKEGKMCVFWPQENERRMLNGCTRMRMPQFPDGMLVEGIDWCLRENAEWMPPYRSGASMYIRPVMFGTSAQLRLGPSEEFTFVIYVSPVGEYYACGSKGAKGVVVEDFDRAAPRGLGHVKAAGNYAADIHPSFVYKAKGFDINLYLDAVEKRYIEEFNSSNFVGITKDGVYVTPDSPSVLPSVTNKALQTLAKDRGMRVERRSIDFDKEIETFVEVGAVGTAVVVNPIASLTRRGVEYKIPSGPVLESLREEYHQIQLGERPDTHGWMHEVAF